MGIILSSTHLSSLISEHNLCHLITGIPYLYHFLVLLNTSAYVKTSKSSVLLEKLHLFYVIYLLLDHIFNVLNVTNT